MVAAQRKTANLGPSLGPNGEGYRVSQGPTFPTANQGPDRRRRDDSKTPLTWAEKIRTHYVKLVRLDVMYRLGRGDYELLCEFPLVLIEPPAGTKSSSPEAKVVDVAGAAMELADQCWEQCVSNARTKDPRADYQLLGFGFEKDDTIGQLFEVVKQCWEEYLGGNPGAAEDDISPTGAALRAMTVSLNDSRGRTAAADKRADEYHKIAIGALQAAPDVINGGTAILENGIAVFRRATDLLDEASTLRAAAREEYLNSKKWDAELKAKVRQADKMAAVAIHGIDVMGAEAAKAALLLVQIFAEQRGVSPEPAPATLCEACDQFSDSVTVKQQLVLSDDCAMELFSVLEACAKMVTDREAAYALKAFLDTYSKEMNLLRPLSSPRQKSLFRFIDGEIAKHTGGGI